MLMYPLIIMVKQVFRTCGANVSFDYHCQYKNPRHMLLMYPLIIVVTYVSLDYHGQYKFPRHMLLLYPLMTMVTNVSLDYHGH